ncbi:RNA-directed DNA polymerase, eukaryota, reverse transcriptase zinc-binding domain protein [Tanacetum coccineum]
MVLLLKLNDVESMSNMYAIKNSSMKNLYSSIKTPLPSFKVDERMIWIEISGLPLCAWGSNTFKKVASLFGKFKFFKDEESTAMSSRRVCISTQSYKQVFEKITVEVNGEMFDVHVHEIGTWSINITDNTSDTSFHMDVNGLEKDDIFVDDNPNDDLNNLNDKLNELAQATKDDKIHFECLNVTDLNQPREQVEEEVIKVSDTSDLSRPPGFEHVKRSSLRTSKYSTNFARHQKKDIKGHWNNAVGDCYMINIYGPQETSAKSSLWNCIAEFMHQHNGKFILFGDMNTVRHENKWSSSLFSHDKANHFNSFIESSSLIDLPIGGRYYTLMNKEGTKLIKLDRFLISKGIPKDIPDIRVTAIDRMWSDHTPILLHAMKLDFGPSHFKFYNSWLNRDSFDDHIKSTLSTLVAPNDGGILRSHEKLRCLKTAIKQWHSNTRNNDCTLKQVALSDIKDIEKNIDDGSASSSDRDKHIKLLQDINKLDKLEALDLIQKAHIKWDIEGDENSKFFHGMINNKRRSQAITRILYDGVWILDPLLIKEAFLNYYKEKF